MNDREELIALRRMAELEAKARGTKQVTRETPIDPTEGMSGWEKAAAGAGKAIYDTGLGIRQLASYINPFDTVEAATRAVDESRALDAPLMNTGAGIVGNIAGNIATFLVPGGALGTVGKLAQAPRAINAARAITLPKTVLGAAGVGGAQGFIQPVASDESRIGNTALGAAGGAVAPAVVSGGRLVRDTIAPFTKGGADRIAGRAIERFAGDKSRLTNINAPQYVPGSLPTLAEATGDPGIAQLQRALANQPDIGPAIADRLRANTSARASALRDIAGDQGQRDFFAAAREANAQQLYGDAFKESASLTPWVKGEINKLQARPAFRDAWKDATRLAQNEGIKLDRKNIVQVAHYTKMALDDQASRATGHEQRAILATRDKLVSLMESKDFAPSYRQARAQYAADSAPINQMDIGQQLYDTLRPALADFGAVSREHAGAFAKALRDADATAARATGFKGARMDRIMTPEQMGVITGVAQDLGRAANAADAGRAIGSNTAQNLISQDILRQTLGPLGLPSSWAENALAQSLMRPVSWAYKVPEQNALKALAGGILDPQEAERLLALAMAGRNGGLLGSAIPYATVPTAAGMLSLAQ